jgi:asparagine synthase (glutamine-hydrolysing)
MCGIAAIVDYSRPASIHERELDAMRVALRHRGPDGEGRRIVGPAALAATRLAIQDAPGGAQPFSSPDGRYLLVYNGELYDPESLKARLDVPFRTRCDTEILLWACIRWGVDALPRLNGMFAFFFWDTHLERGFAARDRLGVKPIVYERRGEALLLASEARALLATRTASPRLHAPSVIEWVIAPQLSGVGHGCFEDVEILPAGHFLAVDRGRPLRAERWGGFDPRPIGECLSAEEALPALSAALVRAARHASRADVPVGAFLSGGLDSTVLSAVARDEHPRLPAFAVRFQGQDQFDYSRSAITLTDDTPYAVLAAELLDLDLRPVDVPRADLLMDLAGLARINDALPAWEQELAQHRLARAASRDVKVVLVGDAADETHWGYHFMLDDEASAGPTAHLARFGGPTRAGMLTARLRENDPLRALAKDCEDRARGAGHPWPLGHGDVGSLRDQRLRATTHLIVTRWLPRLLHNGDVHTMAFSLEARVPFCDVDLLDLAERIPPSLALAGGIEKRLLRQAAPPSVPDAIRWRKKSALPKDQATEATYRSVVRRIVRDPHPTVESFLDLSAVHALTAAPPPLSETQRAILFQVIVLDQFCRAWGVTGGP